MDSIRSAAHGLRLSMVSMRERCSDSLEWTDAHSNKLPTVETVVTSADDVADTTCLMLAMEYTPLVGTESGQYRAQAMCIRG